MHLYAANLPLPLDQSKIGELRPNDGSRYIILHFSGSARYQELLKLKT